MKRGKRITRLYFVKEQSISIENFDLAIDVIDKIELLKKRTHDQLRLISYWRIIENERIEFEHQEQLRKENERKFLKKHQIESGGILPCSNEYSVGEWVEVNLKRWNNSAIWYRGQVIAREKERIMTDNDILLAEDDNMKKTAFTGPLRVISYSVKFSDVRMSKELKFIGSSDITGRIIEQILPIEMKKTSGPKPPMKRRHGDEYIRKKGEGGKEEKGGKERVFFFAYFYNILGTIKYS